MGHDDEEPGKITGNSHNDQARRVALHKVTVKGSGGVTAAVLVTVRRGQIWLSVQPPFTWEAIMTPGKVEELVRTLAVAGEEAEKMASGIAESDGGTQAADQSVGNGTGVSKQGRGRAERLRREMES